MNLAEYRRALDPLVRPDQFEGNGVILVHVVAHLLVVTGLSLAVAAHLTIWPLWSILLLACVSGHSIVCLGFAGHELDPMLLTLTVTVPKWADFLHIRFSHHVEHHLYPNAGPKNYPRIRAALLAKFPERYNVRAFGEAYRTILVTPLAHLDPYTLVDADGGSRMTVPLPGVAYTHDREPVPTHL
ncbi:MAG: fatty acid desaturase [Candidatus Sericytochromatia bacterium]|nr:fatty acid desaturase [Candidatus Sericytochromatia bacterium]